MLNPNYRLRIEDCLLHSSLEYELRTYVNKKDKEVDKNRFLTLSNLDSRASTLSYHKIKYIYFIKKIFLFKF